MNNKKIIIGFIILSLIIVIGVVLFLIIPKYDKNMIGTFYAKGVDTTYILKIDGNHTATLTYREYEENKEKKLTWNNKHINDNGVEVEYTFENDKLLVKYIRGTLEFSKDENIKRTQKFYQVMFNSDADDIEVSAFEKYIDEYLIVSNVKHISKEETKNTLLNMFNKYSNEVGEELLSSASLNASFTMTAYGTNTELDILKNVLESSEIVRKVYETNI